MRSKSKKNLQVVIPAVAAAGLGAWLGVPAAHASINLAWNNAGTINGGADTVWVLTAQNDGLAGAQQQPQNTPTGTGIVAMDLTLSTPGSGTAGAMLMDVYTPNKSSPGYDIDGQDPNGGYFGSTFANLDPGTFIGFGNAAYSGPVTESSKGAVLTGQFATSNSVPANGGADVWVNSQTYANFTHLAGTPPAPVSAEGTPAIYSSAVGTVDPAFTSNTLHSLETIIQAAVTNTLATPIANLVIPTGTVGTAIALITPSANPSNTETYTLSTSAPPPTGPSISLTSSSSNTAAHAPITIVGSNGSYQPQSVTVASGAATTGELTVSGFNPASDEEIYVLSLDSNGTPLTSGQINQVVTDLNSTGASPSNATIEAYSALVLADPAAAALFPSGSLVFISNGNAATAGAATTPDVLAYDFSGETAVPNVTVTAIGVVPEPTGVGVLVLGGLGLMARRRRMNRASA